MAKLHLSETQRKVLQDLDNGGKLYTIYPGEIWRGSDLRLVRKKTVHKLLRFCLIKRVSPLEKTNGMLTYAITGGGHCAVCKGL